MWFITAAIPVLLQAFWIGAIVFGLETLTKRAVPSPGRQLRGVAYTLAVVPIVVIANRLLWTGARSLDIKPLADLGQIPWLGTHPAMLATVGCIAFVLLIDFLYYWIHRLQHAVPILWKIHAVHHSVNELSALNQYSHWAEFLILTTLKSIPAALLFQLHQGPAAATLVALMALQQSYLHSASTVNFGRWSWLLNDNRRHRIHHSIEPQHFDRNFGINFGFWDHMFGTAYVPAADEWPDTGVAEQPEPANLVQFLTWPARPRAQAGEPTTPARY